MVNVVILQTNKKGGFMPRGDQSGPEGLGPMTGRRMGSCRSNVNSETNSNFGLGRGFRGRYNAGSFGFRNRRNSYGRNFNNPQISNKDLIESEIKQLKEQLLFLENEYEKLM
jgi:hypothetical protein